MQIEQEDKQCSKSYDIDMLFYQWRVTKDGKVLSTHGNINDAKRECLRLKKKFCGYNAKYKVKHKDLYDEVR